MPHPARASRPAPTLPPLLLAAALLAGCGMNPPQRPPQELAGMPATQRPGYVPERRYTAAPIRETWQLGKLSVDTIFLAPATAEKLPLIIYLPGLGESAAAGQLWRQGWAEAGYAVLSLQPPELGEAAWSADPTPDTGDAAGREAWQHRSLEHRDRVREQFAAAALARRLDLVAQAVVELRRRAEGSPLYAPADTTRLVVAGYDIGAQTAAALAGEQIKGVRPPAGLSPVAAITLSPYVELSAGTGRERFAAMKIPLLAVTGTEDDDPEHLVSAPALRRAPWQSAPAGDKYLLVLENGIHRTLGGNTDHGQPGGTAAARDREGSRPPPGKVPRALPFGGRDGPGGMRDGPEDNGRGDFRSSAGSSRHPAIVQTVSLAFLDAVIKNDPVADEWLRRDATRWLAGSAGWWMR